MSLDKMKKIVLVVLFVLGILTSTALAIIELKETIQEVNSESWAETRKIEANEYHVYKFQGTGTSILNVSLEVISGDSMDTFLLNSEDFANYQSMMQGGSSNQFNSYPAGKGMNLKYMSYSFELPTTGIYYIVVDNTFKPSDGGQPGGSIDVKIKFAKNRCPECEEAALEAQKQAEEANRRAEELRRKLEEEANQSKEPESTPGFQSVHLALILVALFYLKRIGKL